MNRTKPKPFDICEFAVREAYKRVKKNKGVGGIDGQSFEDFEKNKEGNLYKVWNRMSSGSYFPSAVRQVDIPKGKGEMRTLGIPTIADRVAQMVAKLYLEPIVDPRFHEDSYGYRPNRSAIDAVRKARKRCWHSSWVIDLDIKGFFDNLDHELMMKAVRFHTNNSWIIMYIERWLQAPIQRPDGQQVRRDKGSPQGSVISPLLANLFMHHAFDDWMRRSFPSISFERYADDIVVHCKSRRQSIMLLNVIKKRLAECNLELHPKKTKIVYCINGKRKTNATHLTFDFLGFTFQPRQSINKQKGIFVGFLPAISQKAKNKIHETMRSWKLTTSRYLCSLDQLAQFINPYVRGWVNYYGSFYKQPLRLILDDINRLLVRWAKKKYKRFTRSRLKAQKWLRRISDRDPNLFYMWTLGVKP